jgi:dephospho-CoA kinase
MYRAERTFIIGVTGSIGSGKSLFCHYMESWSKVYYTDDLSHKALEMEKVFTSLLERWGDCINLNGNPNRAKIAEIVFNDAIELNYLNALLHPIILNKMQVITEANEKAVICFEVPLLFEANMSKCFDYIVLVTACEKIRLDRLIQSKRFSEREAEARMQNQLNDSMKTELADMVIVNENTPNDLESYSKQLKNKISQLPYRNIIPFNRILKS